jgi:hypothetical protein
MTRFYAARGFVKYQNIHTILVKEFRIFRIKQPPLYRVRLFSAALVALAR